MASVEVLITQLEETQNIIKKAQINLKKCPKSRLKRGYLKAKLQCVDEYWSTFRHLHDSLVKITKRDEKEILSYFTDDLYSECEDQYISLKADLFEMLEVDSSNQEMSDNKSLPSESSTITAEVKLPQINLPMFSGAYEEWQSFEDTFLSLIHKNGHISDVQKLHYLKSCISGEAKNVIKHLTITEKNYLPAWDALKRRYSHKRLIVDSILKKFFALKKLSSQSSSQLKTLMDTTNECLNYLNNLEISTDTWDPIIIFLVVHKLDRDTHKDWESYVSDEHSDDLPKFQDLTLFLENKIRTLELTTNNIIKHTKERVFTTTTVDRTFKCSMCNEDHLLCYCKGFSKLEPEKRNEFIREKRLCYNCLSAGHPVYNCRQKTSCKICGKRHHSLLHYSKKRDTTGHSVENQSPGVSMMLTNVEEIEEPKNLQITSHFTANNQCALLATVLVPVRNKDGHTILLRALMDQGSQATFISERATQLLKLKRNSVHGKVTGVGSTETTVNHMVQFEILSRYEEKFGLKIKAYVMPTQLTTKLPSCKIKNDSWSHLEGLFLADPSYSTPGRIDVLFGVNVYSQILKNNLIKGPLGTPCAQETTLGWLLFGNVDINHSPNNSIVMHHQLHLDNMLRNMWELENSDVRILTTEQKRCEEIYTSTHSRLNDGRYIVKLPFKVERPETLIGETRNISLNRFHHLEKKLERDYKLKDEYTRVIEDYLMQKHMEEVPQSERNRPAVYLPHHAVRRDDKETTKTRIVFDASCKGTNNVSLNDQMLVGPPLQEDLRNLIMRWRMKKIAILCDIKAMYRQILVTKENADLQRILWRKNKDEDVQEYRLLRVTFGTAAAPYIAVRTLLQVADDEGQEYPNAVKAIKEDFYMDDMMSGHDTVEGAIKLSKQVTEILSKGGFELQKWSSNDTEFMKSIPIPLRTSHISLDRKVNGIMKALGLVWNMGTDSFQYECNLSTTPEVVTKRSILTDIQRLFDPLGWLGPAIIPAKIIIQKLWLERLTWDERVNSAIEEEWSGIRENFKYLNEVQLSRWMHTASTDVEDMTIHGFCDASTKAYAAVVYCRVITPNRKIITNIVAAKTKVAPVKPVSLPRLELCGAVLLSKLLKQIREALRIEPTQIYAWTDSSVVLSWLFGDPNRWKPFVSNRVVEILENTCNTQWFHVISKENPADIASRGLLLCHLIKCNQWWEGPEWLKNQYIPFKRPNVTSTDLEQKSKFEQVNMAVEQTKRISFENFDTLDELLRVITYVRRFINSKRMPEKNDKHITTEELEESLIKCLKIIQIQEFEDEIRRLNENKPILKRSNIKSLSPFLDKEGVIRVGGRLRQAKLDKEVKHPIIIGSNNTLAKLIINNAHRRTLHGGIQLMLAYLRSRFWIIKAKTAVKYCIHKCLICAKRRATLRNQIMGDLPEVRVTPARAFLHCGVDFAGPLQVLGSKGRGSKTNKAYIAIFICMSTKAIHLELVGDLTSEAFIGSFKRFTSRRGRCAHMWSDQGRNFVGANKELNETWKQASLNLPNDIVDLLVKDGTQWHFIPPYSPNFGGLWEAGVKSVKFHLKRILIRHLTFEEMATVLCEIEACLNSRPLCPIEDDPDCVDYLTPGHFLVGEALVTVPSPDIRHVNINRLSRWQHTQKLLRDFWHRWQTEYLSRLQERPKWLKHKKEFETGDIVLVREDNLPPGKWALGRIVAKHPGQDKVTRVYSVKCGSNVIKRSISKLCALPIDKN